MSAPFMMMCFAVFLIPAFVNTSRNETPVHRAGPTAPFFHCSPRTPDAPPTKENTVVAKRVLVPFLSGFVLAAASSAALAQSLLGPEPRRAGSRLVEGRFMGVQQSIAVPKGRDAGLAYLRRLVEDAKVSGLVARAIEKTGAKGVSVAPPAK